MTWTRQAACKDADLALFFPDVEGSENHDYSAGLAVCAGCPVKEQCLEAGLHDRYGVWGNTTPSQRWRIARQRTRAPRCQECGVVLPVSGARQNQAKWCNAAACQRAHQRARTNEYRQRQRTAGDKELKKMSELNRRSA